MKKRVTRFFHPVMKIGDLKKTPVPIQIDDEKIVLFRDHFGKVVALKDQCPHRLTPLSIGHVRADGKIACHYHGWSFNSDGAAFKPGPKNESLPCKVEAYQVQEKYDFIWVGNKDAVTNSIPSYEVDEFKLLTSYSLKFEAPFEIALDNFSEDEHFPFVHKIFGWDEPNVDQVEFSCEKKGNDVHVNYWGPQRNFFGMQALLVKPGQYLDNRWIASFDPVRTVYTTHLTDKNKVLDAPGYNKIVIYFVPEGTENTRLQVFHFVRFEKSFWWKILPLLKPVYVSLVKNDLIQDAVFTKKIAKIQKGLHGMKLGKFDKPLVYNRQLLSSIYYENEGSQT